MTYNKKPKDFWKIVFNISSDALVQHLGFQTMILNTLYLNNIVFIREFNETRDEKYIKIIIDNKEELKNPVYAEELHKLLAFYDIHTNESNTVLGHSVIVALYSYYERALKKMLLNSGVCLKDEMRQLYKFDYLKKIFIERLGFEYEDWGDNNFLLLEEIRCISNCIKHSGFVSTELNAINNKWIIDEEIKDILQEDIFKFIDVPHLYLKTLVDKVKNQYFKENNVEE